MTSGPIDVRDLAAAIAAELKRRGGRQRGKEMRFSCPAPDHGDENPSADWNAAQGAWICRSRACHELHGAVYRDANGRPALCVRIWHMDGGNNEVVIDVKVRATDHSRVRVNGPHTRVGQNRPSSLGGGARVKGPHHDYAASLPVRYD